MIITKELIQTLIDENKFDDCKKLDCPECTCIEDDQYYCLTCEGHSLKIHDIVKDLFDKKYNGKHIDTDFETIYEEASVFSSGVSVYYGENDVFDKLFDTSDEDFIFEPYNESVFIYLSNIFEFLIHDQKIHL